MFSKAMLCILCYPLKLTVFGKIQELSVENTIPNILGILPLENSRHKNHNKMFLLFVSKGKYIDNALKDSKLQASTRKHQFPFLLKIKYK